MYIDFFLDIFTEHKNRDAIIWREDSYTYSYMLERIEFWQSYLKEKHVEPGTVVIIEADFSPNSVALLLALIELQAVIVPLTSSVEAKKEEFIKIAQGEVNIKITENDNHTFERYDRTAAHQLYAKVRKLHHPALVLFSSGSTGESKAAVHDFSNLLKKYHTKRHDLRTLTFLLFDHIGGVDTMLYSLSNGSCIITVQDRSPDNVCRMIEQFKVEVLPVTPTFLNLMLISQAYERYDLSSLKYITYGTEIMPEATLKRCAELFPDVILMQKFGTTEVGTLRSKSQDNKSLWVKIGGKGFDTRVVDGILHIKAESAMLGYLNAPSPFSDDGWFITGDSVEQKGEYVRFLGRKSEIINVGGEKVYPSQVENIIQQLENIAEVVVYGEKNPIVGNIVCAKVRLIEPEDPQQVRVRIKKHCREQLENYMVPVKIELVSEKQHSARFKKKRK